MSFKRFLIWSSGSGGAEPFIQFKKNIMGYIHVMLYETRTSGSGGNVVKNVFYLELWLLICSVDWNHLCNFEKRHEEQSCEFNLNLDQWFRRKCCLKVFLILGSGSPFCSAEHNHLCHFGKGYYEKQFCENILNLGQ